MGSSMNTILLSAERDLRAMGSLSDATCRAFTATDNETRRGLEASFAFLGCPNGTPAASDGPVPAAYRVTAIRLMMLRVGAHTSDPRWSSHLLERLIETALQPPGALVGDVVQALFELLAEAPPGLSDTQANLIREVGVHVVGIQRRRYSTEDFSWLAGMIQDASTKLTAAQGYLAACTLPPSLASQCLDTILHSLQATRFEEEVKRELAE
jgi:hypothetical protein